jgi:hypothetical protein
MASRARSSGLRSALLDPQVAQQPLQLLGVGVVILPAGEVANLQAGIGQLTQGLLSKKGPFLKPCLPLASSVARTMRTAPGWFRPT